MIKVTMSGGVITAGRKEIGEHFAALPDGEHFIISQASGSAESEMQEVIEWFNGIPVDFVDIAKMQQMYNRLSVAVFRFTNELTASAFDEVGSKVENEKQYILKKNAYINSGTGSQAASAAAKGETISLMQQAEISRAIHEVNELKMSAASKVLTALMMHLSLLKKERESNENIKGDSFPHSQKW